MLKTACRGQCSVFPFSLCAVCPYGAILFSQIMRSALITFRAAIVLDVADFNARAITQCIDFKQHRVLAVFGIGSIKQRPKTFGKMSMPVCL